MQLYQRVLLLLFLTGYVLTADAQLENTLFKLQDERPVHDSLAKRFYVSVDHLQYFKNNEYFSKIEVGQTYFGFQLMPQLVYFPNGKTRLEAGIYLRKDYGDPGFRDILPTITVKIAPDKHNEFNFGNITGSLSHNLIEPLYNFERVIYDRLEYGQQHRFNTRLYKHDAWLYWERMIYRGSPYQESISGGYSASLRVKNVNEKPLDFKNAGEIKSPWYFHIPLQMIANHQGGQIDSTDLPIMTRVNTAVGIKTGYSSESSFITDVDVQAYFAYYKLLENRPLPFTEGRGWYLNLMVKMRNHNSVTLSYWNGDGFCAVHGGALYQSVTQENTGYTERHRRLLIARFFFERPLYNDFYVSLRLEPYYDFGQKLLEYSNAVYISYKGFFRLKK